MDILRHWLPPAPLPVVSLHGCGGVLASNEWIANRDLATIEKISAPGEMSVRLDDGRAVTFSNRDNRHFDHGNAVTSHSSEGLTADRVLVHVDISVHPDLINSRFA